MITHHLFTHQWSPQVTVPTSSFTNIYTYLWGPLNILEQSLATHKKSLPQIWDLALINYVFCCLTLLTNWKKQTQKIRRFFLYFKSYSFTYALFSLAFICRRQLRAPLMSTILCISKIIFSFNDYQQRLAEYRRLMKT